MKYQTPRALRTALEQRIGAESEASGISHDRLRRRVVFQRVVARLHAAERGVWVVKGGMALEMRLRDEARLTKDLDLGLRAQVGDAAVLQERLVEALSVDADGDLFVMAVRSVARLMEDEEGRATWRAHVVAELAEKPFGSLQLDVSPRADELQATDQVPLPNALEFAGITTPVVEVIDLHMHVAEKFHGMLKVVADSENTRVRDLVDIVLLWEHGLIDLPTAAAAIRLVWSQRAGVLPESFPELPVAWPARYETLAGELGLDAGTFQQAVVVVRSLWSTMFPPEKS